jgi:hypothetical protein
MSERGTLGLWQLIVFQTALIYTGDSYLKSCAAPRNSTTTTMTWTALRPQTAVRCALQSLHMQLEMVHDLTWVAPAAEVAAGCVSAQRQHQLPFVSNQPLPKKQRKKTHKAQNTTSTDMPLRTANDRQNMLFKKT